MRECLACALQSIFLNDDIEVYRVTERVGELGLENTPEGSRETTLVINATCKSSASQSGE